MQHRAMGTLNITASRCQGEDVEKRSAQLGCELGDAGSRDAPIGAQEQHGFGVRVEAGFQLAGAVTDDGHVGVVVAVQCSWVSGRAATNVAPNACHRVKPWRREFAAACCSSQNGEPAAEHVVEQHILLLAGVDAGLDEQRADWRDRAARLAACTTAPCSYRGIGLNRISST